MSPSLDPQNWDEFRSLGHRMLDDMVDAMSTIADGPVWTPPTAEAREALSRATPLQGEPLQTVYDDFVRHVLPYPTGNAHPRFFGWVMGNGTPDGMLAEMLAAAMNPHVGGYNQSAALVERQALSWLREIMGYPQDASGLMVSGGTMANLIGVMVARNQADSRIRESGLCAAPRLTIYGSDQTHSWVEKSADILGLGRGAVRRLASDEDGKLDLDALRLAVEQDRQNGCLPFCVVGNAGTVDGGVVDDLDALADYCAEQQLWFHVDGAFGALLAFSEQHRGRLEGMQRSDSLAFDLHKWGYLQYELGCVLVRDGKQQRATFATEASYLEPLGRGIQPDALEYSALGPQLSRGFRALRVWMGLRHHGVHKIGQIIDRNVAQAQRLADQVDHHPLLERLGPAPLNVVCFRFRPADTTIEADLKAINREILLRIQESGEAIPSSTVRNGRFALRVAITNHRTQDQDIDQLVAAVLRHGQALTT